MTEYLVIGAAAAAILWAGIAVARSIRADRKRAEALTHDERREDWIDRQ